MASKLFMNYRAMSIILGILSLLNIILNPIYGLSCKDESGLDVDSWTIMKLPNSTDYYYYDISQGFGFSSHSMNDTTSGALTHTINQLWNMKPQYMIYNDEPPNQVIYNYSVAHSKAVWLWDTNSALLITHSIPKFPLGPKEKDRYVGLLENAWEYGQTVSCLHISIQYLTQALTIVRQSVPLIYDEFCHDCYEFTDTNTNESSCSSLLIDNKYTMFMKPSAFEVDIWTSCISTYFSSDVLVESWIHGIMDGPSCPPEYSFKTLDIQRLTFPKGQSYSEYDDHSKWGILKNPIVCFGDLNRVTTQMTRTGTVYCWKDTNLWIVLNSLIVSTNTC